MIPAFLQDLSLPVALSAYCANVDPYIQQSSNEKEHVVDLERGGVSCFVTATQGQAEDAAGKYFEVRNPNRKDFALLQIDHGIINTNITKCDCAIADNKELCFIEFKANATSSKTSSLRHNYKKAMRQLGATITYFTNGIRAAGNELTSLRSIEAYVCFRHGFPRKSAAEMGYQTEFALQNNGCPLSFEPLKELI